MTDGQFYYWLRKMVEQNTTMVIGKRKLKSVFNGLAVIFATAAGLLASAAEAADVRGVRFGVTSASQTRIVVDLRGAPTFRLGADGKGQGRLLLEISDLGAVPSSLRTIDGRGLVASGAYDADRRDGVFVFTLAKSAKVVDAFSIPASKANPNDRLVIDLKTAPKDALFASVRSGGFNTIEDVIRAADTSSPAKQKRVATKPLTQPKAAPTPGASVKTAAKTPTPSKKKASAVAEKLVVVIDPGHGGNDPGSIAKSGALEKNITLNAALELKRILEKTDRYKVVLTRAGDDRLALPQRTKLARDADADLFISLHADALGRTDVRGASVYTLSEEGAQRSAAEAAEEGDYLVFDRDLSTRAPAVRSILFDLAQQHTENQSAQFAALLVTKLGGVTPLLNNTHRRGNLKVLLAPDVPAVLLELGFLSNTEDVANLVSAPWRRKTMTAVADAIDSYFDKTARNRHASVAGGAQ